MYADDTSLLVSDCDPTFYQNKINAAVREISNWFNQNSLYLNAGKTKHIPFLTRQRRALSDVDVVVVSIPLSRQPSACFLGVIFDETLTFHDHCTALIKKLNTRCYQLRNLRTVLNIDSLVGCYYAFVHSPISYGIIIWGSSTS